MSPRDRLRRRTIPSAVVRLSTVDRPHRWAAAGRRAIGGRAGVALYFAFDDAYSAVALAGLARLSQGRRVRLALEPVVERGIADDPAREAKRRFAVVDSARLARRLGLELSRRDPLAPDDVAFLADWAGVAPAGEPRLAFCLAAMNALWFASEGPVDRGAYERLWAQTIGSAPPNGTQAGGRSRLRRGLYDTPVAVVHGRWYFAHERLAQVGERLDELGWKAER